MQYSKYSNADIGLIGDGSANMQVNINSLKGFYIGSSNIYSATAEASNTLFVDTVLKVSGLAYGNGYVSFTNYSDERLKKNIIDIDLDKCYENFKTLKFKRFKYIFDIAKADKTETGLIAQSLIIDDGPFKKSVEELPYYEDIIKTRIIKKIVQEEKEITEDKLNEDGITYTTTTKKYNIDKEIEVEEQYKDKRLIGNRYTLNYDEINKTALCVIQKLQLNYELLEK
jgi:hypothetical protein